MLQDYGKVPHGKVVNFGISGVHTAGRQYRTISPLRLFRYDHRYAEHNNMFLSLSRSTTTMSHIMLLSASHQL
jgi:hypothetical protein